MMFSFPPEAAYDCVTGFRPPDATITITAGRVNKLVNIQPIVAFPWSIDKTCDHVFTAASSKVSNKNQAGEFAELTERELGILDLIAQGHNNAVIANNLSLSIKTVQNYVSSILTKLQVADCAQAIVRAREAGFGKKE